MNEWLYIIMITAGVALFAIGGTGFKWARRFILPCVFLICIYFHKGVHLGIAFSSCALLSFVLHLGYGEKYSWRYKFFIGCCYAVPSLLIGWSWWTLIMPLGFWVMFFLSNFKPTEKSFFWKGCESGFGFLIAMTYCAALQNLWVTWK